MVSKTLLLAIFLTKIGVKAQYGTCDVNKIMKYDEIVYLNHQSTSSSCIYTATSPPNTIIETSCSITTTCNYHIVWLSRSGDKTLKDGKSYCGNGNLALTTSIGNEFTVAINNGGYSGASFSCRMTARNLTDKNCDCSWNAVPKIVGGIPTLKNELSSHVALLEIATKDMFCGATIIQQSWALSAAHCFVSNSDPTKIALLAGDWDTKTGTDTPYAKAYLISQIIKHKDYNEATSLNDIALVQTKTYIKYNLGVAPACLPYTFNGMSFVGKNLTAVGWGTTSFGGPASSIVLKTDLAVMAQKPCNDSLFDLIEGTIDITKLCTFGNGKNDTCGKDSGGALYTFYNGRNYPIAIVNFGIGCASKYPSVNTRIDRYFGWIENTIGGFFCRKF